MAIADLKPSRSVGTILGRYGGVRKLVEEDFSAIAWVPKGMLLRMAMDEEIGQISIHESPRITSKFFWSAGALFGQSSVDLNVLARSAYSHSQSAIPGDLAANIRAGTFESGLNAGFLSCLGVTPAVYEPMSIPFSSPGGIPDDSVHTLVTFTNLVNAAPGAKLYHRNSWSYQSAADQSFIVRNEIASLSMSTDGGGEDVNHPENRQVDDFAYRYPYPVFSNPTANDGWFLPPRWAAYNAISVGNVQDSANQHFKIDTITCGAGATRTRNPNPVKGGCIDGGSWPNCAGDREMPYLVAPGYTPFANHSLPPSCYMLNQTGMTSSCISQGQLWGTSMSAPTVNGMAASLIRQNIYLLYKPELTRAILMNTARNVHGTLWDQAKDGKDGAGVIHGADAIAFATNLPHVTPQSTAKEKAFNYATYCESHFVGSSPRAFNIVIPNPKPANQHFRVVFTWNSFPDLTNFTNELPDIDITMITNAGNRYSNSWDANVEILDIPAGELTAGGSYSVNVYPMTWRRTSGARGACTYGALTWGFVTTNAR